MDNNSQNYYIHHSAYVDDNVTLGKGIKIWHFCHIREKAVIGDYVSLGKNVYIDEGVTIGNYTRIQNGVSIYRGVKISEGCFIGPHVVFTNDMYPRVGLKNWEIIETKLETGMSIGAGAIIVCGITIGSFAMVGAGAVVTKSIPPFHLYIGVPAKYEKIICACGFTKFQKINSTKELLRECCKERLYPHIYNLAATYIESNSDLIRYFKNCSKSI